MSARKPATAATPQSTNSANPTKAVTQSASKPNHTAKPRASAPAHASAALVPKVEPNLEPSAKRVPAPKTQPVVKVVPTQLPPDAELREKWDWHHKAQPKEFSGKRRFDLLIFVVNDQEMQAALRFVKIEARINVSTDVGTSEPAYIGTLPCVKKDNKPLTILLLQSGDTNDQGSSKVQAMLQNIRAARVEARMYIAAGCCFGFSAKQQKLLDVAVSSGVLNYERVRLGPDGDIDRNVAKPIDVTMKPFLKKEEQAFTFTGQAAHMGIMLCGDKLVDDATRKQAIMDLLKVDQKGKFPNGLDRVVGGEMEGSGMVRALEQYRPPQCFLVVKGISDWGENKGGEKNTVALTAATAKPHSGDKFEQVQATFVAFAFIASMLRNFIILNSLPSFMRIEPDPSLKERVKERSQLDIIDLDEDSTLYPLCQEYYKQYQELILLQNQQQQRATAINQDPEVQRLIAEKKELEQKINLAQQVVAEKQPPDVSAEIAAMQNKFQASEEKIIKDWTPESLSVRMSMQGRTVTIRQSIEITQSWSERQFCATGGTTAQWHDLRAKLQVSKSSLRLELGAAKAEEDGGRETTVPAATEAAPASDDENAEQGGEDDLEDGLGEEAEFGEDEDDDHEEEEEEEVEDNQEHVEAEEAKAEEQGEKEDQDTQQRMSESQEVPTSRGHSGLKSSAVKRKVPAVGTTEASSAKKARSESVPRPTGED